MNLNAGNGRAAIVNLGRRGISTTSCMRTVSTMLPWAHPTCRLNNVPRPLPHMRRLARPASVLNRLLVPHAGGYPDGDTVADAGPAV